MSLIDLKKSNNRKVKKKNFTIDEFISDAEDYAIGKPKVVSGENLNLEQAVILAKQPRAAESNRPEHQSKKSKPAKRHATFTLSEDAIAQLDLLAKETHLAKSHILRIMIHELCNEEQQKKLSRLLKSGVD
ncbi:hypothetical protein [Colwellia sp. TT2012]|uniref:hypothetical protein n=1 Tax=Colwellia sp. TT2012 TaxID=1720342 RepID=UPI000710EB4C|nr:hypothetical protein [Colwellia sp. TT2012]